jgi:hypothetical protein
LLSQNLEGRVVIDGELIEELMEELIEELDRRIG